MAFPDGPRLQWQCGHCPSVCGLRSEGTLFSVSPGVAFLKETVTQSPLLLLHAHLNPTVLSFVWFLLSGKAFIVAAGSLVPDVSVDLRSSSSV